MHMRMRMRGICAGAARARCVLSTAHCALRMLVVDSFKLAADTPPTTLPSLCSPLLPSPLLTYALSSSLSYWWLMTDET